MTYKLSKLKRKETAMPEEDINQENMNYKPKYK